MMIIKLRDVSTDFKKIFYREEGKELYGRNYSNFLFLVVILFLTFLAIGFANGSLNYLKKKMDDPFIKWVNVEIPFTIANTIPDLIKDLENDSLQQLFQFNNCTGYNQPSFVFHQKSSDITRQFSGRTIEFDNQILESIMSGKNLIAGRAWKDEFDVGLLVTKQFLSALNYGNEIPSYIYMDYPKSNKAYLKVPLPVVGVVHDLPGNNQFAFTPYFYAKRISRYYPFDVSSSNYQNRLIYNVDGSRVVASQLANNVLEVLRTDPLNEYYTDTLILANNATLNEAYKIYFNFSSYLTNFDLVGQFDEKLQSNSSISESGAIRIYDYDFSGFENETYDYDNLSVYFSSLDRIRDFSAYLFDSRKLKIDMSQIESKENYNFVSKLTIFISGFLVIFSVISILLFLSNVLKVHINKIKSNLGTFKAFGMSNLLIVRIYSILTLRFLIFSILLAFIISAAIGETGLFRLLFKISDTIIDDESKYFSLISESKTYIAIGAMLFISLIILPRNIWKMLNKTPGDLIYKRD
jgi:hypothetical protein